MDSFFDRWDPVFSSMVRYALALPVLYVIWRFTRAEAVSLKPTWVGWGPVLRGSVVFPVISLLLLRFWLPETRGRELEQTAEVGGDAGTA